MSINEDVLRSGFLGRPVLIEESWLLVLAILARRLGLAFVVRLLVLVVATEALVMSSQASRSGTAARPAMRELTLAVGLSFLGEARPLAVELTLRLGESEACFGEPTVDREEDTILLRGLPG